MRVVDITIAYIDLINKYENTPEYLLEFMHETTTNDSFISDFERT